MFLELLRKDESGDLVTVASLIKTYGSHPLPLTYQMNLFGDNKIVYITVDQYSVSASVYPKSLNGSSVWFKIYIQNFETYKNLFETIFDYVREQVAYGIEAKQDDDRVIEVFLDNASEELKAHIRALSLQFQGSVEDNFPEMTNVFFP